MKRILKILLPVLLLGVFVYSLFYLYKKSEQEPVVYSTETAFYSDIVNKTLATGSIKPREEIDIKPQVSGIIQTLYVEAGDEVKEGDLIAKIKVIPDMVQLNSAENRVESAKINLENAKLDFDRNKKLYYQEVISFAEFQRFERTYKKAQIEYDGAQENLEIVKEGSSKKMGKSSLTLIKSTVTGMVLDVPVKVGNQVIESNNFNDGTTVATVANMNDMIFEGLIDESEVGKIKTGMDLLITIGAIEGQRFNAKLEYIAPKGTEQNGAIQFQLKAKVELNEDVFIRAGYSANADIVLSRRDSVLAINEGLIQFDETQPYVEVSTGEQLFERKDIKLGVSDGIKAEVLDGISSADQIKVWNR
jgi:HlyD family secretion protein